MTTLQSTIIEPFSSDMLRSLQVGAPIAGLGDKIEQHLQVISVPFD